MFLRLGHRSWVCSSSTAWAVWGDRELARLRCLRKLCACLELRPPGTARAGVVETRREPSRSLVGSRHRRDVCVLAAGGGGQTAVDDLGAHIRAHVVGILAGQQGCAGDMMPPSRRAGDLEDKRQPAKRDIFSCTMRKARKEEAGPVAQQHRHGAGCVVAGCTRAGEFGGHCEGSVSEASVGDEAVVADLARRMPGACRSRRGGHEARFGGVDVDWLSRL